MRTGAVIDVIEVDLRGRCVWLETGVEAETGPVAAASDPTATRDEIFAFRRRRAARTAVDITVGASKDDLLPGLEGQVQGVDGDRPGPCTVGLLLLIDDQRGQRPPSSRIEECEHLIRGKGIDAEREASKGDFRYLRGTLHPIAGRHRLGPHELRGDLRRLPG